MNPLRGLFSFGELIVEAFLQTPTGNTLVQWICGRTHGGHSYKVSMVMADESLYSFDPLTSCKNCDAPMSESSYNALIRGYVEMADSEDEVG